MILEQVIREVVERQNVTLKNLDSGLPRQVALGGGPAGFVEVITGIRRCGKSTILRQKIRALRKGSAFFLNVESPLLCGLSIEDSARLDVIIAGSRCKNLFFDEIQMLPQWELFVRQKLDEGYRVTVTGSNASLLSRELGAKLTGRHLQRELFPFSYAEFLAFRKTKHSEQQLRAYLHEGGFPEYLKHGEEAILQTLFEDILVRDIAVRHGIKELPSLRRLALYLGANIGARISASKLRQVLEVRATSTLLQWFDHLADSYLFFFVSKFCCSEKARLVNPRKVYCVDTGLREALSVAQTPDEGRLFENLVFLQLRRRYKDIFYFDEEGECDFVVLKNGKPIQLVQATMRLYDLNMKREVEGLRKAMDFFKHREGVVVTFNQKDELSVPEGIIHVCPFCELD